MRYLDCVPKDNLRVSCERMRTVHLRWDESTLNSNHRHENILNASFTKCHATRHGKNNIFTSTKKQQNNVGCCSLFVSRINGNFVARLYVWIKNAILHSLLVHRSGRSVFKVHCSLDAAFTLHILHVRQLTNVDGRCQCGNVASIQSSMFHATGTHLLEIPGPTDTATMQPNGFNRF